ncbi:GNAT family N-acetyltransferase [Ramlibacter sp. XY19]|uniref:GNAT family N-acetyltransferase n=1 Tax=Ramlibacter paludis TaxID=2908000 RepID=UPI0023DB70BD|nr:GNAT family N-acetyltransferase [Ramlibacter paludis]MCG2592235.1 GNAT family N-acetyltransferase [Ramlibacter paludis]
MAPASASVEIRPFDPRSASRADWEALHAYRRQRAAEEFPDAPFLQDADFEHEAQRHLLFVLHHRFLALSAGEIVGNIIFGVRRPGTEGYDAYAPYVDIFGGVLKQQRRRGVGRALFAHLHDFMVANGKSLASIKVLFPDGHGFVAATGAQAKFRSVENHLAFGDVPWAQLPAWRDRIETDHLPLRWEMHVPRVPIARLAQLMAPFSNLSNQQPLGELEMPRIRYELAAFEAWYRELDLHGGEHYLLLLKDGDEVAAVCDANWDARVPGRVHQSFTAVAAPWRNQGVAQATKAAMLLLVRERRPEVTTFTTYNAQSNAPMLAVNRKLGFRVHREECTYQLSRDALGAFLGA